MNKSKLFFLLLLSAHVASAQNLRDMRYWSISSDNDYYYWFGYSDDRYYTAGNSLTYGFGAAPKNKFVNFIFPSRYDTSASLFSIRIFQQINTPTYLETTRLETTDYPYASALYLSAARNSPSPTGNERWKTEIDLGVIGPSAGGEQAQELFHRIVKSPKPMGWGYQIPNELILDYHMEYEKKLLSKNHHFLNLFTHAAVGTMSTYLQAGFFFNFCNRSNIKWSDISLWPKSKKWILFLSLSPTVRGVVWNGMLEGAPFQKHESFYRVAGTSINRLVPVGTLKIVVARGRHILSGQQTFMGPEFSTVDFQVYGTITYMYRFGKDW